MTYIVLVEISQEAADASKMDILSHASRLQCDVDVVTTTSMDDLSALLKKCDILAIESKAVDANAQRIFQMMRDFSADGQPPSFAVIEFGAPIGEPCFKKWFEHVLPKEIPIPLPRGQKAELVENIAYFESKSRKVYVKTHEGHYSTTLCMSKAKELTHTYSFLSPYVGYLVNLLWVEQIGARDIVLKNKETLPLSQKRASAFRKAYRDFIQR
ncbi:MAG: LytTR family transcriptional regulator DNA-binding domain-containing protein [Defluviitaleaceae bacterium]|nr:LytTR family transcriptional regulator DNA-binding domain-containing protein [Defluviitaleaceae bacterium]